MDAKLQTAARNTIVQELVGSTDVKGWQASEGGGNGASAGSLSAVASVGCVRLRRPHG